MMNGRPIALKDDWMPRCDGCDMPISDPHTTIECNQEGMRNGKEVLAFCYTCSESVYKAFHKQELGKRLVKPAVQFDPDRPF